MVCFKRMILIFEICTLDDFGILSFRRTIPNKKESFTLLKRLPRECYGLSWYHINLMMMLNVHVALVQRKYIEFLSSGTRPFIQWINFVKLYKWQRTEFQASNKQITVLNFSCCCPNTNFQIYVSVSVVSVFVSCALWFHAFEPILSLSRSHTPKICCTFSEFIVTVPICSICFSTFKTLLFNFSQIESIDPSECLQNVFVWKLKWV